MVFNPLFSVYFISNYALNLIFLIALLFIDVYQLKYQNLE